VGESAVGTGTDRSNLWLDPAAPAGSFYETALVDDRSLVDGTSNLAAVVPGHNIELVTLSLEATESRLGRNHGARRSRGRMRHVDRDPDRSLALLEKRREDSRGSELHQSNHARGRKDRWERVAVLRGEPAREV